MTTEEASRRHESPPSSPASDHGDGAAATSSSSKKRKAALPELEVDLALPEPPSKKAKRLLKKGKPLPPKPASDDEVSSSSDDDNDGEGEDKDGEAKTASKSESKKGSSKKEQRSQHGVWIGNLPFTLTRRELFRWLVDSSGGAIAEEAITRVNLPTSKEKGAKRYGKNKKDEDEEDNGKKTQNKGFAYVDFASYEASVAAVALSETELGGRRLLIKDSKSFEGRPAPNKQPDPSSSSTATNPAGTTTDAASTNRKIFVGNLGFTTTEEDLWSHFEPCGEIDWVKVATFEDTGKCKGYGWVRFREPDAAAGAVRGFVRISQPVETEEDFTSVLDTEPEAGAGGEGEGEGEGEDDKQENGNEEKEEKEEKNNEEVEEKSPPQKKKPTTTPAAQKTKTRKWWVNTLKGRSLKIQFAEDDQVRYKRRFGKDATQRPPPPTGNNKARNGEGEESQEPGENGEDGAPAPASTRPRPRTSTGRSNGYKGAGGNGNGKAKGHDNKNGRSTGGGGGGGKWSESKTPRAARPQESKQEDINIARRTGAVVASQGKKISFE